MADVGESNSHRHGEFNKAIANNFQIVENMRSVITEQMVNLFSCSNKIDLINIATGHKTQGINHIYYKWQATRTKSLASTRT